MTRGFNADPSSAAWLKNGERVPLTREERTIVSETVKKANEGNAFKICYYGKPVGQPVTVKKSVPISLGFR